MMLSASTKAQIDEVALTEKLEKIQKLGFLPGFAVAVLSPDGIHYQKGFGYSDLNSKKPFTIHSLQNIGSISKTLTGVALVTLIEEGKLDYDTLINDFLPFKIQNPKHHDAAITIRQLATHTSSIVDADAYEHTYVFQEKITIPEEKLPEDLKDYIPIYNKNIPMSLIDFIKGMMHPSGSWYSDENFLKSKPGSEYEYSNMNAAIAGYIIEQVSGKSYEEYTQEIILNPLSMSNSGWSHEEIDSRKFVSLYLSNNEQIPPYSLISFADGGLITSIYDMSLFFHEMIKGYFGSDSKILSKESFTKMMSPVYSSEEINSGMFWTINRRGLIGHTGGDPGIMTFMMFDPKTRYGRIIFTNKYDEEGDGYNQLVYIWKTLGDFINMKK